METNTGVNATMADRRSAGFYILCAENQPSGDSNTGRKPTECLLEQ